MPFKDTPGLRRVAAMAIENRELVDVRVLPGLTRFLTDGGRKIDTWYAGINAVEVLFDDNPGAFSNVNTEAELKAFEEQPLP